MKLLVILLLSLCAFQFALGEVRTYGRPVWNGIAGRAIVPIPTICNSSDKILKTYCDGDPLCDAKNVITCTSSTNGFPMPCPAEKPYCTYPSDGAALCSATPPPGNCAPVVPTFQCTNVGYYPDPNNCRVYYNCYRDANGDLKAEALSCPTGYVFDPNSAAKQYCLYTSVASKCVTVTGCDGVTSVKNVAIPYTNCGLYVAVCLPGDLPPLIYLCPTGTKPVLDSVPLDCEFKCPGAGQYAYSFDKYQYYDCKYNAQKVLFSERKPCPQGTVFEKTVCVRE